MNCASLGHMGSPRWPLPPARAPHQPSPRHCFPEKESSSLWLSPPHRINTPSGQGDGLSPGAWWGPGTVLVRQLSDNLGEHRTQKAGSSRLRLEHCLSRSADPERLHHWEISASQSPTGSWTNESKLISSPKQPFRK